MAAKKSWLGPERGEWTVFLCGYAPQPGDLHCNRDVAWHGFVVEGASIRAMMECCEEHLPVMRLSADYVHPMVHPCGIPGSRFRWPENECYTDWDESELAASALIPEAAV